MNYLRIIESEDLHMKEKEFKNVRWGDIYYCDLGVTNGSVQSGIVGCNIKCERKRIPPNGNYEPSAFIFLYHKPR